MRVLIFGDSLVFGSWDSQGGWADRLKRDYNKQYQDTVTNDNPNPHQIIGLGIGGNTSRDLMARFEQEYLARHSPDWPAVIVIAIGVNDTKVPVGKTENLVPIDEYRSNLRQIVQLAKKYSDKVLLVGLFPLQTEKLPFKNVIFSQSTIKQYDAVIDEVAAESSVPKVEIFHEVIRRQNVQELFFADGLHPNDAGHQVIYDLIKPVIAKLLP